MKRTLINFRSAKQTILENSVPYLMWLANNVTNVTRDSITPLLRYCEKLKVIKDTRGIPQVIQYNKGFRLEFLKWIFSLNPEFQTEGYLAKPSSNLRSLAKVIAQNKHYGLIRVYLSGLYITRGLRTQGEPSFHTIEQKPSLEETFFDAYKKDMFSFLKNELGLNPKHFGKPVRSVRFKEYHMSSKSGPQGHALWTSFLDILNIPTHLALSIYYLGGPKLESKMHRFYLLSKLIPEFFLSLIPRKRGRVLRKVGIINDKEGKTREVAIGDYWSQTSLKPLHDYLFKLLSRIEQDCTHNQGKLLGRIHPTPGSSFHSIDLSSATDRFPIRVEYILLETLFGTKYASCWKHVMVYLPFIYRGRSIYYRTGNPMGMYSSWATFAICHHFLVYLSCKKARIRWKDCPYMLLGDDIVIADDKVAQAYKDYLVLWDIPFSPEKTHTSPFGYEFAKQIILHGKNVSPLPLAALYERRNSSIEGVGILLNELWGKNWKLPIDKFLESYFLKIQGWHPNKFKDFKPKLKLVTSLLSYFHGLSNLGPAVMQYVEDWTKDKFEFSPTLTRAYARWLAVKTTQRLFLESRDRVTDYSNKQPLGYLAEELVILITSLSSYEEPQELIQSVPFLQIYGRAEEVYISLLGDLNDKGLGSSGKELRRYIGKVDIPLSDRDFYVRHRDVLIIRALRSSRILEELIKTTPQVISWTGKLDFTLPWYEYTRYSGELLPDRRIRPKGTP